MTPEQLTLEMAALCLQYPEPGFAASALAAVAEALPELPPSAQRRFGRFLKAVRRLPQLEWECRYTQTFDFEANHALHLTFHELGENAQRGAALVALKKEILLAGFDVPTAELPDYIPLLLEFLAVRPTSETQGDALPHRLARVLKQIASGLAKRDPLYVPIFRAALAVLPEPTGEALPGKGPVGEDPDVPYPIAY